MAPLLLPLWEGAAARLGGAQSYRQLMLDLVARCVRESNHKFSMRI